MSRSFKIINTVLAGLGVIGIFVLVFVLSGSIPTKEKTTSQMAVSEKFTSVTLPNDLNFAGERVPLENFDVREALDKELLVNTYWHSQTFLLIKRANRFFPEIEPILKRNGIPEDFKFLALAESGFANVVSPAGASGMWQFVKPTALEYGLEVNDEVDERYNIEKATEAACKYFKNSYERYKSWTMAAASYNMGLAGLSKQISRQYSDNYYDILLNEETSRYVFRIAALKLIVSNPEAYGFSLSKEDLYPPFRSEDVVVNTSISDIAKFAMSYGTNYKMIKMLNPWLRDNVLTNKSRKTYVIKIPVKGFRNVNKAEVKANVDTVIAQNASKGK